LNPLLAFWAKLGTAPWPDCYHPVLCHLIDVGQVASRLWSTVFRDHIREWVRRQLGLPNESAAETWLAFWAGAHDIGKVSPAFQFQSGANCDQLKRRLCEQGFKAPSPFDAQKPHGTVTAVVLPKLLEKYGINQELARRVATAVGGHHGSFPRSDELEGYDDSVSADKWREAREQITDTLAKCLGINGLQSPGNPCPGHAFFMFLAGLTSVADWIGSNQTFFQLVGDSVPIDDYVGKSEDAARCALQTLGWVGWRPPEQTAAVHELFPKRIKRPEDSRPLQRAVAELADQLTEPSLVLIEAPMGEGKTEAAMFLADYWAVTLGQQGCYFALPTAAAPAGHPPGRRRSNSEEAPDPFAVPGDQLA
jgi:CRISPR-associated endonuclease/helicase Cas3